MRFNILLIVILLPTPALSDIYKYQAPDGKITYTSVPCSTDGKVDNKEANPDCKIPEQNKLSSRWKTLGQPEDQLYFDSESFVVLTKGNICKAWLLWNIPKDSARPNRAYQSAKLRIVINCTNKSYINKQSALYEDINGFGKLLDVTNETSDKPAEPVPDSFLEFAVTELCKRKK